MRIPDLIAEEIFFEEQRSRSPQYDPLMLSDKLEAISGSNNEILLAYPADAMKQAVEAKIAGLKPAASRTTGILRFPVPHPRMLIIAASACCVLALSLVMLKSPVRNGQETNTQGILAGSDRIKGAQPMLFVYQKVGETARLLPNESRVSAGDTLQISYVSGAKKYGAIISVDGNGSVFQHFPEIGNTANALSGDGEIALDFAYQLDEAPAFERFFFICGDKPFQLNGLRTLLSEPAASGWLDDPSIPEAYRKILETISPGITHIDEILLRK